METLQITESKLTQLINELQQDQTTLFNLLKNANTEKDRDKNKSKKVEQHSKQISKLLDASLKLKNLLNETKNIK
jgi:molybdopterin-biosynthesis enzyme MoeA-like protein